MERVQAWQRFEAQRRARVLGRGGALVTAVLDHGDLARAVSEHLSPLGIESCYLAILDPPDPSRAGRTARLVLAYEASDRAARPATLSYRAEEILPYAAMSTGRQAAWVVAELGSRGREQALLIVDLGQPEGHAYEALRHIFGAVLAGARLGPDGGSASNAPAEGLRAERAARVEDPRLPADLAAARDAVAAAVSRCRALSEARGHLDVELGAVEGLLEAAQNDLERLLRT
jgi:hypothetical protein